MFSDSFLIKIFKLIACAVFLLTASRLVYLQVAKHSFYSSFVDTQSSVKLDFTKNRAAIRDIHGRPLAVNKKVGSLYIFGKSIDNPSQLIRSLEINGIKLKKSVKESIKSKDKFIWISRHIDVNSARKIASRVSGIEYCIEDARLYPEGKLLKGVLGFTGVDNQGLEGIEFFEDFTLKGKTVPVSLIKDSRGQTISFDSDIGKLKNENAIYLTLDIQLQSIADALMKEDLKAYKAKAGIAVAMDIRTGAIILATAVNMKDGPQTVTDKNYATSYLFEPGSIFKTVTYSYLVENGRYNPKAVVDTSKKFELYGHTIKDVGNYGKLTQRDIFTKSSNIGIVTLTNKINRNSYYAFLTKMGFGKKLGVSGVHEEAGVLRDTKNWSGLSLASLSMGHEILTTPVQMLRFYAAVGNGGIAVKPSFINHYYTEGQSSYPIKEEVRLLSAKTSSIILDLLAGVVSYGTGKHAQSNIVSIGGKTGTAQLIDRSTNSYSKTDYIASFAGIFPLEEPRIAMLIVFDSPKSSIYGGATGAVTFKKIAEQISFLYGLGNKKTKV